MTPHACMRETASCADAACAQGGDKDPYVLSMRGIDHKARLVSTRDQRALPAYALTCVVTAVVPARRSIIL